MLTRAGITYDLSVSPYTVFEKYGESEVIYFFSSELYRKNFKARQEEHRNKINQSLSKRFGFEVHVTLISDMKLYRSIEKRGFLIYLNGRKVECLQSLSLGSENAMKLH